MPIDNYLYEQIRKLSTQNMSTRTIARELGCSRHTVAKYREGAYQPQRSKETAPRSAPLRETVYPRLKYYVELNEELPKKQKMSGHTIWLHLTQEGYTIGESTVRYLLAQLKKQTKKAFVPLEFLPGEVMQVDWGEAHFYLNGKKTQAHCFCASLPYSAAAFVAAFPRETLECFLDGHQQAFGFFQGVTNECVYDNLRAAVLSGSGKHAVQQETFQRFTAHHAYTARFCNVAAGWEKSNVENLVAAIRQIAFAPMPRVESWSELQQLLTQRCFVYCETHRVKRRKTSIKEALTIERKHLHPMPVSPWDASIVVEALVHTNGTCVFETNRYSVPVHLVGRTITLQAAPFTIRFYADGKEVANHPRSYEKDEMLYNPEHYLSLLERKPGAIHHAAPLRQGQWPLEIATFRSNYKRDNLNHVLVEILRLFLKHSRDLVLKAVQWANEQQNPSIELILHFLDVNENPAELDQHMQISEADLNQYDTLLLGEDHHDKF